VERRPLVILSDGSFSELPIGDTLPGTMVGGGRTRTEVSSDYTILDSDRNVEVTQAVTITLPLTSDILHYENIDIINTSTGTVTVNTTSPELIEGKASFKLYKGERITVQRSIAKYIIK
jgi:hypothetical protein